MLITRYNYGGQIKEDEMRRAYTMHGGHEKYVHNFHSEYLTEGDHMENLDLDFVIILRLIFKGTVCKNFERIQLDQARVQRELRLQRL
jgi:hypothetical protein